MIGVVGLNVKDIGKETGDGACLNQFADKRDREHFHGEPLERESEVGDAHLLPFTQRSVTRDGVEWGVNQRISTAVLLQ